MGKNVAVGFELGAENIVIGKENIERIKRLRNI